MGPVSSTCRGKEGDVGGALALASLDHRQDSCPQKGSCYHT